jgi:precorrin-2/cobalt-factor-2 C20-methyltransferase
MARATFFGVGVGPGDPKLMTIRAGEIIRDAHVLAYPVNGSGESRARSIAAPIIVGHAIELPVHLPMQIDREPGRSAYDDAAQAIKAHLDEGRDVAWLCVGDPMFYGSFMYMAGRLEGYGIEIVPGVTSLSACAARTGTALAGRNDILSVVPATLDEAELRSALERADCAVVIKVGRHFDKVRTVLRDLGLEDDSTILEAASGPAERTASLVDIPDGEQSYFSTILVRRETIS